MRQVTIATLLAHLKGSAVTVFDLRPERSVAADGVPGARPLSLEALQAGEVPDVPKSEAVYLICERGTVSELAGLYLEAAGFSEVYNVTGGMRAYRTVQAAERVG